MGPQQLPRRTAAFHSVCAKLRERVGNTSRERILSFLFAVTENENSTKMSISLQGKEFLMEQKKRKSCIKQNRHSKESRVMPIPMLNSFFKKMKSYLFRVSLSLFRVCVCVCVPSKVNCSSCTQKYF